MTLSSGSDEQAKRNHACKQERKLYKKIIKINNF